MGRGWQRAILDDRENALMIETDSWELSRPDVPDTGATLSAELCDDLLDLPRDLLLGDVSE